MTKTLTIIIGLRSTISESQKKIIKNSIVISSDFLKFQKKIMKIKKYNFNLIFNNFYPSAKIDKVNEKNYLQLNELCLKNLSLILSILNPRKIKKIFYTSSSSVYIFSKELNHDFIDHKNRRLQAAYKLAAENLITNYSLRNKIKYYVMRVFNTYGNSCDKFSFIEKIIYSKNKRKKIVLNNGGLAYRDFIHIDDVSNIYNNFIKKNFKSGFYDVGSGRGYKILDIINFVNFKKNLIIKRKLLERKYSIANLNKLKKINRGNKIKKLDEYLINNCKLNKKKKLKNIPFRRP